MGQTRRHAARALAIVGLGLGFCLAGAACTPLPDLGPPAPALPASATPALLPAGVWQARAAEVTIAPEDTEDLLAQADTLRARAERLRRRSP